MGPWAPSPLITGKERGSGSITRAVLVREGGHVTGVGSRIAEENCDRMRSPRFSLGHPAGPPPPTVASSLPGAGPPALAPWEGCVLGMCPAGVEGGGQCSPRLQLSRVVL